MAAFLFNSAEHSNIVSTLSTEGPMWNRGKIAQAISQKTFKNYTILYMYIAQGQGQVTHRGQILIT